MTKNYVAEPRRFSLYQKEKEQKYPKIEKINFSKINKLKEVKYLYIYDNNKFSIEDDFFDDFILRYRYNHWFLFGFSNPKKRIKLIYHSQSLKEIEAYLYL